MNQKFNIGIDFDGTCVKHEFPNIGADIGAVPVLKALVAEGHNLILFTMRSDKKDVKSDDYGIHARAGDYLTQSVNWFKENDIPLYGIQTNPTQKSWTDSPKAYAHIYIDDAALGSPLVQQDGRAWVDWEKATLLLQGKGLIRPPKKYKRDQKVGDGVILNSTWEGVQGWIHHVYKNDEYYISYSESELDYKFGNDEK
jgi:hypothetical protein